MKMLKWFYYVVYEYKYRKKHNQLKGVIFIIYLFKCLKLRKYFLKKNKDWFLYAQDCHSRIKKGW